MPDVNLMPRQRWLRKRRRTRLRLWAAVCAVYFASLALGTSSLYAWFNRDNQTVEQLGQTIDRVEKYSQTLVDLKKLLAETRGALQTTWAIRGQPDWSELLVVLSNQLGDQIVLDQCALVSLTSDGRPLDDPAVASTAPLSADTLLGERHYALRLSGQGRQQSSVSQFVLRLEALQFFDSVRLEKSRRQSFMGRPAVGFRIECRF